MKRLKIPFKSKLSSQFYKSIQISISITRFEDIGASNGHFQRDDDDEDENDKDDDGIRPNGVIRSARIKKASKEHVKTRLLFLIISQTGFI